MTPLLLSEFLGVISRNSAWCVTWSFHGGFRDTAMPPPQTYQTFIISECCASLLLPGPLGVHTPKELPPLPWNVCPPSWPTVCVPIAPPCVFQGPRFMASEYNSKYIKETPNHPGRPSQLGLPSPTSKGRLQGGLELVRSSEATRGERRTDIRVV